MRMNRASVRAACAGLARYLLERAAPGRAPAVVIGCDARHGSTAFADEAARVTSGAGLRVLRLPAQLPTPLLAFAVRHLHAAAGVMITASHNPASDNGLKVYLADGAQPVPPADAQIAAARDQVERLSQVELGDGGEPIGAEVVEAYLEAIIAALPHSSERELRIVYTPLHGVGAETMLAAFARAGFSPPAVVAAQSVPDADFPTLERPNPEEPHALDLALRLAAARDCDLVLANDPDGDRLAVAIPDGHGSWRRLSGDEVGALLGEWLLEHAEHPEHCLLLSTIVSSSLLELIAQEHGATFTLTLTGFKWLMDAAARRPPQLRFLFAYEEALGYAVNEVVRDKDGISAALVMAAIAAEARAAGATIGERLDALARRHGLHATRQLAFELAGEGGHEQIGRVMSLLRQSPPATIGASPVGEVVDLLSPPESRGSSTLTSLPPADVVVLTAADGLRVVARPSGTEPKLKVYLQLVQPLARGEHVAGARRAAETRLDHCEADLRRLVASA
jgi:phosphomannomutase